MSLNVRQLQMAGGARPPSLPRRGRDVAVSVVFVAAGFAAFPVAAALLLLWAPQIVAPGGWAGPHALALTHVLALGFISSVAVGVLYHVAPLALGAATARPVLGVGIWVVYVCGVVLLVTGLGRGGTALPAVGGPLLAVALLSVLLHLGDVARRARRRYLPAAYQAAAVVALVSVAALGTTLALMLRGGGGTALLTVLAVKVLLAIGGWLGVLVIGVSYQLVPMFTLSAARPRFAPVVLPLLAGGVLLAAVAVAAGAPAWLRCLSALPYAAAVLLHVTDVARLMLRRRSRWGDPVPAGQALGALLQVAGAVEGVAAMSGASPWPQLAVVTALVGWAPVLIAANGVRIVPFIFWQGLPPGRRPRTYAPAPALLGWVAIAAALVAWASLTAAMAMHGGGLGRAAGAALLLCAAAVASIGLSALRDARRLQRAAH